MTASPGRHPVVRAADGGDRAALRALLAASALPVADLDGAAIEFLVAADDDIVVGVVGLERFDDTALLRSLAVRADRRGSGLGDALVRAAEELARAQGVTPRTEPDPTPPTVPREPPSPGPRRHARRPTPPKRPLTQRGFDLRGV